MRIRREADGVVREERERALAARGPHRFRRLEWLSTQLGNGQEALTLAAFRQETFVTQSSLEDEPLRDHTA
jgi:uncharacterized protein involved in exopolysaccharide biosynthesis